MAIRPLNSWRIPIRLRCGYPLSVLVEVFVSSPQVRGRFEASDGLLGWTIRRCCSLCALLADLFTPKLAALCVLRWLMRNGNWHWATQRSNASVWFGRSFVCAQHLTSPTEFGFSLGEKHRWCEGLGFSARLTNHGFVCKGNLKFVSKLFTFKCTFDDANCLLFCMSKQR